MVEQLEIGGVYRTVARNLGICVWDGRQFIGIRTKFGNRFLDAEFLNTAHATEKIGDLPAGIPLRESLPTVCNTCGKPARWTGPPAPAPWECESKCTKVDPVAPFNKALFDYIDGLN